MKKVIKTKNPNRELLLTKSDMKRFYRNPLFAQKVNRFQAIVDQWYRKMDELNQIHPLPEAQAPLTPAFSILLTAIEGEDPAAPINSQLTSKSMGPSLTSADE